MGRLGNPLRQYLLEPLAGAERDREVINSGLVTKQKIASIGSPN